VLRKIWRAAAVAEISQVLQRLGACMPSMAFVRQVQQPCLQAVSLPHLAHHRHHGAHGPEHYITFHYI
jgi:hypothetical protein